MGTTWDNVFQASCYTSRTHRARGDSATGPKVIKERRREGYLRTNPEDQDYSAYKDKSYHRKWLVLRNIRTG